jgi:hypothetical protein
MMIEVDSLNKQQVTTVLKNNYPGLTDTKIGKIVDVYMAINKAHDEFTIEFNMSLRHLKTISEMVLDGFTIYDSFYVTCKGIGGAVGLKSLEEVLVTVK